MLCGQLCQTTEKSKKNPLWTKTGNKLFIKPVLLTTFHRRSYTHQRYAQAYILLITT